MADFLKHTSCPKCNSSDANALYTDGSTYCFSCKKANKADNERIDKESFEESNKESSKVIPFKMQEMNPMERPVRGISINTYNKYSYGKTLDGNHIINHFDINGKIIAQKIRYKDKRFSWNGNAKDAVPFGMNLWRSGGKRITITEGELDCLSVAEALGCKFPVISINNGAQSSKNELRKYVDYLNTFDEITLWFDNDEPGRDAVKFVAELFPVGKISVVNSGKYKDANEVLKEEGKAAVLQYYYEAKKFGLDGIVSGDSLDFEKTIEIDNTACVLTPFSGLNNMTKGIRKGELVVVTAGTGIGKTTFTRELAYSMLMNNYNKIGWIALEENIKRSALGLMGLHIDKQVYMDEVRATTDKELLQEAFDTVINNDRIFFFDHFGSLDSSNLLTKLRHLAVVSQVDFIFLDHISIVVSGGREADNERIVIDRLMTDLRSLAEETGVGIIAISHLRRPNSEKGFENGAEITLNHLRGSGAIAQLADTVIAMERDQQSDNPQDGLNAWFRVLKNRYNGETGKAGYATFNRNTGRLLCPNYIDMDREF